jgi:diadenosine tetraphosphatase ApaH/serine/threonine PP2A family protein phosphatase
MRILVCSDIHANLPTLDAVLEDAGQVDAVWCLGDVVGYGPDPNECVARIMALPQYVCLAGNHDWAALGRLDLGNFNTDARLAALWTREQLTPESRKFLEERPDRLGPLEERYTLAHGSPRYPIWEYILDTRTARTAFEHFDTPVCFVGHSHVPVIFQQKSEEVKIVLAVADEPIVLNEGRYIVNPGGVGQPRDGDPRASYVLLDTETNSVTFRRVAYPVEETQARMIEAGLPMRIIARLRYGW